jgi:DNA-binding transcriptional MerR regulator
VPATLTIGDLSRATHLSVKTLRHYHSIDLLVPDDVDVDTGYRRYTVDQIPTAQVIRRFRDLDMPLDQIRAVLQAPDLAVRNELIAAHLARLEQSLTRTQSAVASLRDLLAHPPAAAPVTHRRVGATRAAAITATVTMGELVPWYLGGFGELYATLDARGVRPAGPGGGLFASELWADERGEATLFVPVTAEIEPLGRVRPAVVPGAELAVIVHAGSPANLDRSYGALGAYVSGHALRVDGPIREYYVVGRQETSDEGAWQTEIGWPVFSTGAGALRTARYRLPCGGPTCCGALFAPAGHGNRPGPARFGEVRLSAPVPQRHECEQPDAPLGQVEYELQAVRDPGGAAGEHANGVEAEQHRRRLLAGPPLTRSRWRFGSSQPMWRIREAEHVATLRCRQLRCSTAYASVRYCSDSACGPDSAAGLLADLYTGGTPLHFDPSTAIPTVDLQD